uniref:TonB-dependent receptor n=1 Tax=Steinernema glaseri TaxID=37863 RepID=A0A1I8AD53_9BILA
MIGAHIISANGDIIDPPDLHTAYSGVPRGTAIARGGGGRGCDELRLTQTRFPPDRQNFSLSINSVRGSDGEDGV